MFLTRPVQLPEPVINPSAFRKVNATIVAVDHVHYRMDATQADRDPSGACLGRFILDTRLGRVEIRSYRDKIEVLREKWGNRRYVFLDTKRFLDYFRSRIAPYATALN